MPRPRHRRAPSCTRCGALIIWAITAAGHRQPLDPDPHDDGNVLAYRDAHGTWRARSLASLGDDAPRHPLEKRYRPHFATCRGPQQQELPANVTSIRRRSR